MKNIHLLLVSALVANEVCLPGCVGRDSYLAWNANAQLKLNNKPIVQYLQRPASMTGQILKREFHFNCAEAVAVVVLISIMRSSGESGPLLAVKDFPSSSPN